MSATRGRNLARCAAMVGALVVGTHLGGCRIAWPGFGDVAPEEAAAPAPEPVVATVRVVRERRALPEALEGREVAFATRSPMRVERIAGQLADLLELSVVVEDRPARDGENVMLADSQLLTVASSGVSGASAPPGFFSLTRGRSSRAGVRGFAIAGGRRRSSPACS